MREAQNALNQQNTAIQAQIDAANAQAALAREQLNTIRQEHTRQRVLQAGILKSQGTYQGIPLPEAIYRDPLTREEVDLWSEVSRGNGLSDPQLSQLVHSIRIKQYSAQTPDDLMGAEVIDQMARERVVENKINQLEADEEGYFEYNGMLLDEEEARLAVEFNVDHYWDTDKNLTPEEVGQRLKYFAIGLWNFAYGDDINTILDPNANWFIKAWSLAQFVPVMKVTKTGKLVKLVKFKTKIPLSQIKVKRTGFWTPGPKRDPVRIAYEHYDKHVLRQKEFPEIQNAKQYVEATRRFMDSPPKGTHVKVLFHGKKLFYHPPSNTILIVKNGAPVSFFRPRNISVTMRQSKNKGGYGGFIR